MCIYSLKFSIVIHVTKSWMGFVSGPNVIAGNQPDLQVKIELCKNCKLGVGKAFRRLKF